MRKCDCLKVVQNGTTYHVQLNESKTAIETLRRAGDHQDVTEEAKKYFRFWEQVSVKAKKLLPASHIKRPWRP